jgi:tRNA threonylcarbamoyladenosine biosynthesis protein TsaB
MAKPLILHIETATDICSVALSAGEQLLALEESGPERSHATMLNPFIKKVYADAGREMSQTDAVSVSKGPGSYTGLRIGVSTAKGLAYGLGIPLLACGTLESMTQGVLDHSALKPYLKEHKEDLILSPMLDARRMEVYTTFITPGLETLREVSAEVISPDSFQDILTEHKVVFFGNGSGKCKEVLQHPNTHFLEGINPSAAHMIFPCLKRYNVGIFEDVAYFEPFYLKDFIATTPRKKVL